MADACLPIYVFPNSRHSVNSYYGPILLPEWT